MSWNKEDKDLVAASYGEFDFSVEQNDGAVALWSLKNPTHPERVYSLPCGVTSIDWSSYYPFLLAVGLYDGNVAIYDVRSEDNEPILQSGNNTEKHHDPVWQVSWIDKGMERGECLVSISTDGRVKEWRIKKGLEHQELMMMKETPRGDKDSGGEQNLISHFASGMCFDFSPLDPQQCATSTSSPCRLVCPLRMRKRKHACLFCLHACVRLSAPASSRGYTPNATRSDSGCLRRNLANPGI